MIDRFKIHAVTQDSISARVVLALVISLLETHGAALESSFDKPRRCPMRTCQHLCSSPWLLIDHLLVCTETSKGEFQCPECDPAHDQRMMGHMYHFWRRLSGRGRNFQARNAAKHTIPTSPGLSQSSKRGKSHDFQPTEMDGSTSWGLGNNSMHYQQYPHGAQERAPSEMDATEVLSELPASLSLDTGLGLERPWNYGESQSSSATLCGSLPSGSTDKQRIVSPYSTTTATMCTTTTNTYQSLGHLRHGQGPDFVDPTLWPWVSGSVLTASPEDADIPETGVAPWALQPLDYRRPATTDFVTHRNSVAFTPQTRESALTWDGVVHPGLASAGSQAGGQVDWPLAAISPLLCTPIRTVYTPNEHGAERIQSQASVSTSPSSADLGLQGHSTQSPVGPTTTGDGFHRPLHLAGTTAPTNNAPASLVPKRRRATRRPRGRGIPVTLEESVSEEDPSSPSVVAANLDADADRCPQPGCLYRATEKKNRLTHLRRHVKIHQNLEKLKCPVPDCASSFAAGRKDNLQQHLVKVHRLSSRDVLVFTTATSTTPQTMSSGSGDSSVQSQTLQQEEEEGGGGGEGGGAGEGKAEDWEGVEDRERGGGGGAAWTQDEILSGILLGDKESLPSGMPESEGDIYPTELDDLLDLGCESQTQRPTDLPATAHGMEGRESSWMGVNTYLGSRFLFLYR